MEASAIRDQSSEVEIVSERETADGWSFEVRVGAETLVLGLSWADYDLWSADGADPPHAVAQAVVRFLLSRTDDLPSRLDASTTRRRFPDADEEIPKLIADS